jgi:hypothetical protein
MEINVEQIIKTTTEAVRGWGGKIGGAIIFPILLVTFLLKKSDKKNE